VDYRKVISINRRYATKESGGKPIPWDKSHGYALVVATRQYDRPGRSIHPFSKSNKHQANPDALVYRPVALNLNAQSR
jgi:hypothetical protein